MRTSRYLSSILASILVLGLALILPISIANGQTGQNSLALNGTSAYAEAPHAAEVNTTTDWTIEAWFKDETSGGYNHARARIITKGDTATSAEVPYFIDITTNSLFAGRRVGGSSQIVSYNLATNGVSANAWHHVAATFQNVTRRLTLYLDGVQVAQVTLTVGSLGNTSPVSIGRNGGATPNFWNGKLDDVRIWNVVRNATEIQNNFHGELPSLQAGL